MKTLCVIKFVLKPYYDNRAIKRETQCFVPERFCKFRVVVEFNTKWASLICWWKITGACKTESRLWWLWFVNRQYWCAYGRDWVVSRLHHIPEGPCVLQNERERESVFIYIYESVWQKGGALSHEIHGLRRVLLQCEGVGDARRTGVRGFSFGSDSHNFPISLLFWMNPAQANTLVIRGKRNDGLEAVAQTVFIKVVTFVGLYL